jgi:cell division septal protein FtsQ
LRIEKITLSGIDELDYDKIISKIQASMSGNYLKFFPKNNLFSISKKDVEKDLLSEFKRIRSVEVKKIFPNEIEINISERKSLLIFCKKEMRNGSCYFMDERGIIYGDADLNSSEATENNLVTVIDASDKEISIGNDIYEEKDIEFISDIKKQIGSIEGIDFESVYSTPSRLSGEFRFVTRNGMKLLISSLMPLEETSRVLKVFLKKEAEGQKREFEYIDLRTENKVYYKAKGAPVEENEENKETAKETHLF